MPRRDFQTVKRDGGMYDMPDVVHLTRREPCRDGVCVRGGLHGAKRGTLLEMLCWHLQGCKRITFVHALFSWILVVSARSNFGRDVLSLPCGVVC